MAAAASYGVGNGQLWQNTDLEEFDWETFEKRHYSPSKNPVNMCQFFPSQNPAAKRHYAPSKNPVNMFQFFPSQNPAATSQFHYPLQGHVTSTSNPLSHARPGQSLHFPPASGPRAPPPMLPCPNPAIGWIPRQANNPATSSSQQPSVGYSHLINSLIAQGVISLATQAPEQDFVDVGIGIEFDPNILKVRHESVISALYSKLPRQCTTCGLRFKSQDEHRSHMDWHVTKNRSSMSKNRKQKPSRKWFVSETMWLSAAKESGTESAPAPSFLPTEEKKEDETELAVPAEEDQKTCDLCGEAFDEFYSDETEDWMYRGCVYLNAPNGIITAGIDRSQLGPIIHAKCRSESTTSPSQDFVMDGKGNQRKRMQQGTYDEGNQRKQMRTSFSQIHPF